MSDKKYLRIGVQPISLHLDPTVGIFPNAKKIVVSYGLVASSVVRTTRHFDKFTQLGLVLIKKIASDKYSVLVFRDMIVAVNRGFQEALSYLGVTFDYDFIYTDWIIAHAKYYTMKQFFSQWRFAGLTQEKADVAQSFLSKYENGQMLYKPHVTDLLGDASEEILLTTIWASDSFEPLHHLVVIGVIDYEEIDLDINKIKNNLPEHFKFEKEQEGEALFLERYCSARNDATGTIMDVARIIFGNLPNIYYEINENDLANIAGVSIHRLSGHLKGALIVDEEYVDKIEEYSL